MDVLGSKIPSEFLSFNCPLKVGKLHEKKKKFIFLPRISFFLSYTQCCH